eukprot:TRINITY_DN20139_c0_g1_i1.p1 TRINITY_DN20139_c0_g1~~TRINITY_DN20139_c0_g1_i1.p1  ORF type:complete len:203 (-),score=49.04 TRINITY_DN20139_c0_g1_i1:713-1321(-)
MLRKIASGSVGLALGLGTYAATQSPVMAAANTNEKSVSSRRKIVIAVDHSDDSAKAVDWAIENHLRKADNVTLLHITSPAETLDAPGVFAAFTDTTMPPDAVKDYNAEVARREEELTQKLVQKFTKKCNDAKISCTFHAVKDVDARERICTEVERLDADTLIMGSRGMGPVKRLLLGSVSDYAVNNCRCPVVVVRPKNKNTQ